jgi:hypothetical protein
VPPDLRQHLPATASNVYANDTSGVMPAVQPAAARSFNRRPARWTSSTDDLQVIDHYAVGQIPHHISPAWELMSHTSERGLSHLTAIEIHTGRLRERSISLTRPPYFA